MLWDYLQEAVSGPARFRFIVQPIVAILLGIRDGRLDWALGRAPYLLSLIHAGGRRAIRLKRGLKAAAVPFGVAVVLDAVVQWLITRQVFVWAAVVVACLLIALPYVLARGLANRTLRRRRGAQPQEAANASLATAPPPAPPVAPPPPTPQEGNGARAHPDARPPAPPPA